MDSNFQKSDRVIVAIVIYILNKKKIMTPNKLASYLYIMINFN